MTSRLTTILSPFFIFFSIFAPGCGSHSTRIHKQIKPTQPVATIQPYIMHIDGVECALCAQAVIDIVAHVPGISNVQYHTADATYHDSYLTCMVDERLGNIEEIKGQLSAGLAKEEFSLVSVLTAHPGFAKATADQK